MPAQVRDTLVPSAQRRTLDELTADLDLRAGDHPGRTIEISTTGASHS